MHIARIGVRAHFIQLRPHLVHGIGQISPLDPNRRLNFSLTLSLALRFKSGDAGHSVEILDVSRLAGRNPAKRTYRVALRCSLVQSSASPHNSGHIHTKTSPIATLIPPAIRKTLEG